MKALFLERIIPLIMMLALFTGGYYLSQYGYGTVKEMRQLERVHSSKIVALIEGEANVTANVRKKDKTLNSFYTKTPSVYYRYTEEIERRDADGDTHWDTVDSREEYVDFLLEDETGSIEVKPAGAIIDWSTPQSFQTTIGKHRYTEWRIEPGDEIFVFGMASMLGSEMHINFYQNGQYTPIISRYGEQEERSDMGVMTIIKIWGGIGLISLAAYFFAYLFRIHRLVAYLSILTILLVTLLSNMGIKMMHDDLEAGLERYKRQEQGTQKKLQQLYARGIQSQAVMDEVQLNLLVAREQLVSHMQAFPEKYLTGFWGMVEPPRPRVAESIVMKADSIIEAYKPSRLPAGRSYAIAAAVTVIGGLLVFYGVRQVKLKRYIENVPTSSTKGIVFGVCEVKGFLASERSDLIEGPLSKEDCAWYDYVVKEKRGSGKNSKWVVIEKEKKFVDFICEDRDGSVRVNPDKAEIITSHKISERKGDRLYTELSLRKNDDLYVLGYAGMQENKDDQLYLQYSSEREPYIISNFSEAEIMVKKARKGIFNLNLSFSAVMLVSLLLSGVAGGFAATDFLMAAVVAPFFMIIVMLILHYNDIIFLKQRVERNWSNISVSLKKRMNLIPNLEEVINQYASHEKNLLQEVVRFRKKYKHGVENTTAIKDLMKQQRGLKASINMLQENYPELKSNQLIMKMMDMLSEIENEIMFMRTGYNDAVEVYNTRIRSIPDVVFTGLVGFKEKEFIAI